MFKKIAISCSALAISISGITSSIASTKQQNYINQSIKNLNNTTSSTYNTNSYNLINNVKDTPQQIINKIKNKKLTVPNQTNPIITNLATINAIKQVLQTNNPQLTAADLSFITVDIVTLNEKLNTNTYQLVQIIAKEGTQFALTTVSVIIANQPSPAINLYNPEQGINNKYSYDDDVFLKSLIYNSTTKTVISSSKNLTDSQDLKDYQVMQKTGDSINQGLVLLNRYLTNGFLQYNVKGDIPPRLSFFNSNDYQKQTLITVSNNSQLKTSPNGFEIGDYVNLDAHWNYVSVTLEWKIMNSIMIKIINDIIKVAGDLPTTKAVVKILDELAWDKIKDTIADLLATIGEDVDFTIDSVTEEIPAVGQILDAVITIITIWIVKEGIDAIFNAIKDTYSNPTYQEWYSKKCYDNKPIPKDSVWKLPPGTSKLLQYSLKFHINYFLFGSYIKSKVANSSAQVITSLNPSQFNPSLGLTSAITGYYTNLNDNDFTISIGSDDLKLFSDAITDEISTSEIFKILNWNTPNEIKLGANIPYSLLKTLEDTPEPWQVPQNYMAIIHIKNNQIVWTNLTTEKLKMSLNEVGFNDLDTSFIQENSTLNTLINAKNYLNIESRFMWIQNNWPNIKKGGNIPLGETQQQYFYDTVIKASNINISNIDIQSKAGWSLFSKNLNVLGSVFSNLIKTSKYYNNFNSILNIFYNSDLLNQVVIQTN